MSKINELIKIIEDHEKRLHKLESLLKEKSNILQITDEDKSIPDDVLSLIGSKIDNIKTQSLVCLVLKFYGNLTKTKQIQILTKLGKKGASSLSGGNYARDIEEKGLVHRVGKIGKDLVYSLTEKGKSEAEQLIKILRE